MTDDGRGMRDEKKLRRAEAEKVRRKEGRDQRSRPEDKGERQWDWEFEMRNLELTKDEERGMRDEGRIMKEKECGVKP